MVLEVYDLSYIFDQPQWRWLCSACIKLEKLLINPSPCQELILLLFFVSIVFITHGHSKNEECFDCWKDDPSPWYRILQYYYKYSHILCWLNHRTSVFNVGRSVIEFLYCSRTNLLGISSLMFSKDSWWGRFGFIYLLESR